MSVRAFVRWVRGCLGLDGEHRRATPTVVGDRRPPVTSDTNPRQIVEKPSGSEKKVTPVPTETGISSPDNSEETTPAGVAQPSDETQAARAQFPSHGTEIIDLAREVVEEPTGSERKVSPVPTGIGIASSDHNEEATPTGDGEPNDQTHAVRTQFPNYGSESIDLVIGLDFGTLSTRVVVRSPYMAGGRAVPVLWDLQSDTPPYFLPVALDEDPDGKLTLAQDWRKNENGNLKTDLMDCPDDLPARARAAAYLGLTLQRARGYVFDTQEEIYGPYQIRWAVHVGVPSAGYDDDDVMAAFLCVARAAWLISRRSEPITLDLAMAELQRAEGPAVFENDPEITRVEVIPEIAALVAGYARSRRRREGLHVMMDVGASTADICGFGLEDRDGDDQYFLHTTLVRRLGIRELHHRRMDMIAGAGAEHTLRLPLSLDPFWAVPVAGSAYVADPEHPLTEELTSVDDQYANDCTKALTKVIFELKGKRDPNSSTWKSGLPLFVSGGGGRHPLITRAVREAGDRLATMTDARGGISVESLPTSEGLTDALGLPRDPLSEDGRQGTGGADRKEAPRREDRGNSSRDAERLGVAFGLSFDTFDIGQITPPHEIPDVPRMPLAEPREYISKDHV